MTLRECIDLLFEEDDYFPYLFNIIPFIKNNNKNITHNNLKIINLPTNKKHYNDYFLGKSIQQFRKETVDASIQLRENPKNHISTEQQHLIISYLDDYINQLRNLKNKKILFFKE